jgi:hypothetical protein
MELRYSTGYKPCCPGCWSSAETVSVLNRMTQLNLTSLVEWIVVALVLHASVFTRLENLVWVSRTFSWLSRRRKITHSNYRCVIFSRKRRWLSWCDRLSSLRVELFTFCEIFLGFCRFSVVFT